MGTIWTPGGEYPVDPERGAGAGGTEPGGGPRDDDPEIDEELAAELAEAQRRLAETPARVVVANHAIGLFQLAALHLNQRPPNLEEGRFAIDALAALLDGLKGRLADEEPALREALTQAQLAYVQLAAGDRGSEGEAG